MMRTGIELIARGRVRLVLRFGGGCTHQLDADESEHGDLEAGEEAHQAIGEHAAVIPQVGQLCGAPAGRGEAGDDHVQAGGDQADDGDDLDQGEPELHFTEHLHRHQVQRQQQPYAGQRRYPLRQFREPELCICRDRDHVGDAGDHPAEPVGPAGEVACPGPSRSAEKSMNDL